MKKMVILALLLIGAGLRASTPTFTVTLTSTPTPTPTITPTFTPQPAGVFDASMGRDYVYPNEVYANDGVVLASAVTTPLPGAAAPWVAQSLSATAFVMSTGSAKVRWSYALRGDYKKGVSAPNLNVWAYCNTTATASTFTVTLNVSRRSMNNNLPAGQTVYLGTATSITNQLTNSGTSGKMLRVKLPLSSSARFQPGDHLSFDLQRSGNTEENLYIYRLEMEYLVNPYHYR